uniref:Uncharacterized protein n=1 Tax=Vitis vinifera TaxID=29760 RepID=F6H919_VITVI
MSDNGLAVLEDINGDRKRSHVESTQHQSLALNSITRCIINPLLEVYRHWQSCARLRTHSKVTILDCHNLKEFSVTKAYAN